MDLKVYLKEKGISLLKLSREADIPYATLHDIATQKTDVDKAGAGIIRRLSAYLGLSMDEIYEICLGKQDYDNKVQEPAVVLQNLSYRVEKENHAYYLRTYVGGEHQRVYICSDRYPNGEHIGYMAQSTFDSLREQEEMKRWKSIMC